MPLYKINGDVLSEGTITTIDMYNGGFGRSVYWAWEQIMTAGDKTIQLINNGKNALSGAYDVLWCQGEITIVKVA